MKNKKLKRKNIFSDCNSQMASISTDLKGNIISFNKTAEKILGYGSLETIYRKKVTDIFHPDTNQDSVSAKGLSSIFDILVEKIKSGKVENKEYEMLKKDGQTINCHVIVTAIYNKKLEISGLLYLIHPAAKEIRNKAITPASESTLKENKLIEKAPYLDSTLSKAIHEKMKNAPEQTIARQQQNLPDEYYKEVILFLERFHKLYAILLHNKEADQYKELTSKCISLLNKLGYHNLKTELRKGEQFFLIENPNKEQIRKNIENVHQLCDEIIENLKETLAQC
jgi:PAS domain S-box-containing protein